MKTKQAYIIGVVILIAIGFLLFKNGGKVNDNTNSETGDVTTNTGYGSLPTSGGSNVPKAPGSNKQETSVGVTSLLEAPEPEPIPRIPTAAELDGSTFRLISYNGTALPVDSKYTISFKGFSISAKFCNSLSGNFVLDGSLIQIGNIAATKMYCGIPSNLMEIENSFTSILGYGAQIYQIGNTIVLSHSGGTVMTFAGF